MKIFKVADIVDGRVVLSERWKAKQDVPMLLTAHEVLDEPDPTSCWKMSIVIGQGPNSKEVTLELAPQLSLNRSMQEPTILGPTWLVFFRDRLFLPERREMTPAEVEEILLRAKKHVYEEEVELSGLRSAVANLEAAVVFPRSGRQREPIPEDVKLVVWARDGGACVQCGSAKSLHFDHVIPVAKGGGNSLENIQILCQGCNLRKSDKIAAF